MSQNVNSGRVTANVASISGAISTNYNDLRVQRNTTTGAITYTVPEGKKWVLVGWAVSNVGNIFCGNSGTEECLTYPSSASYVGINSQPPIILPTGYDVRITQKGSFSYYEYDA